MTGMWRWLQDRVAHRDVFVPHSSVDQKDVDWFRGELRRMGYTPNASEPPRRFRERIKRQINASMGAILIETPDAQASTEVGEEIYQILRQRIHLVPVLRRGTAVRPDLASLDWVDFVGIDLYSEEGRARRERQVDEIDKALRRALAVDRVLATRLSLRTILFLLMAVVFGLTAMRAFAARAFIEEVQDYVTDAQSYVLQAEDRLPGLPQPADERVRLNGTWDYVVAGAQHPLATDTWEGGRLRSRQFFRNGLPVAVDSYRFVNRTPVERVRTYFVPGADVMFVDRFASDGSLTQRLRVTPDVLEGNPTAALAFRSPLPPPWMLFYR